MLISNMRGFVMSMNVGWESLTLPQSTATNDANTTKTKAVTTNKSTAKAKTTVTISTATKDARGFSFSLTLPPRSMLRVTGAGEVGIGGAKNHFARRHTASGEEDIHRLGIVIPAGPRSAAAHAVSTESGEAEAIPAQLDLPTAQAI